MGHLSSSSLFKILLKLSIPTCSSCCCYAEFSSTFLPSAHTSFPLDGNANLSHLYGSAHTDTQADPEGEDRFEREEIIKDDVYKPSFLSYTPESKNYLPVIASETPSGF